MNREEDRCMKQFKVVPEICLFDTCEAFQAVFKIGKEDLVITSEHTWQKFFAFFESEANVIFLRKYGTGEPTDEMVEKIYREVQQIHYKRVIAIGGGTILDVAKLFALKNISPVEHLFHNQLDPIKDKELIMIPTTCGTGSEVTNISILEMVKESTKLGLAVDALYAEYAILIPEIIKDLPFKFFATSSIDALIHGVESFLSPKATSFSEMFSNKAIEMILTGYQEIVRNGQEKRKVLLDQFLLASTYAGVAFGNAGCGAVHAMSYPIGGIYHVPHGEANYALFIEVLKAYERLAPQGKLEELNKLIASILQCKSKEVYDKLDELLSHILEKKSLKVYGMTEAQIELFTDSILEKQQRILRNSYVPLSKEEIYKIYQKCYE